MSKRKTPAAGTLTVVVGGTYVADHDMAARLARGDRPSYTDIRAASRRVEPGDTLRAADLPPWTLAQMVAGGFFADAEDVPFSAPEPEEADTDTGPADDGQHGAPEGPWETYEGVTDADV